MRRILLTTLMAAAVSIGGLARAGDPPIPVMQGVTADSDARYDAGTKTYTYLYTARNGAASQGAMGSLFLEQTAAIDVTLPPGWVSAQRSDGSLMVSYTGASLGKPGSILVPGGSMQFSLASPGLPVIKTLRLRADWIPEADDEAAPDAAQAAYAKLETQARVLAPAVETVGSFEHWSRVRDDLALAVSLGWIPDKGFAETVTAQLAAARHAFDTVGAHQAAAPLQALLATLDGSVPAQRNAAALALLRLNAEALLAQMEAAPASAPPPGPAPQLRLDSPGTPSITAHIGDAVTIAGRLTDRADDDRPMAVHPIGLSVSRGPDARTRMSGVTDADGRFSFTLRGKTEGEDAVTVGEGSAAAGVTVIWKGGADLRVSWLIPPQIHWRGYGPMYMHDIVHNAGVALAPASKLRYYVSATRPVDPKTARAVGERAIRALGAGETDQNNNFFIQLPADMPPGDYFLLACADVDDQVLETDESNNCGDSLDDEGGMHVIMMAAPAATTHRP